MLLGGATTHGWAPSRWRCVRLSRGGEGRSGSDSQQGDRRTLTGGLLHQDTPAARTAGAGVVYADLVSSSSARAFPAAAVLSASGSWSMSAASARRSLTVALWRSHSS